jgi:hypothetical protein
MSKPFFAPTGSARASATWSEPVIATMAPVVPAVRTSRLEIFMMHPPEQIAGVAWRSLEWSIARKGRSTMLGS